MSYFVAQVMSKFTVNFGMTFAKKWTYQEPQICQNGNKSTFRQNIGPSDPCICVIFRSSKCTSFRHHHSGMTLPPYKQCRLQTHFKLMLSNKCIFCQEQTYK